MRTVRLVGFTILVFAVSSTTAMTCPVCYGETNSPMTAGMNTAILVMLGITGFVLMAIAAFFSMVWRNHLKQQDDPTRSHLIVSNRGSLRIVIDKGDS